MLIWDRIACLRLVSLLWYVLRRGVHLKSLRNTQYIFAFLLSFRMRRYFLFLRVLYLPRRIAYVFFYQLDFLYIRYILWERYTVFSQVQMKLSLDDFGYILRYFSVVVFQFEMRQILIHESWYWFDFEMSNIIIFRKNLLCYGACASRTDDEVTTKRFFCCYFHVVPVAVSSLRAFSAHIFTNLSLSSASALSTGTSSDVTTCFSAV